MPITTNLEGLSIRNLLEGDGTSYDINSTFSQPFERCSPNYKIIVLLISVKTKGPEIENSTQKIGKYLSLMGNQLKSVINVKYTTHANIMGHVKLNEAKHFPLFTLP